MPKGQSAIIVLIVAAVVIVLYFVAFKTPSSNRGDLQFKNDVVTLDQYTVTDKSPYSSTPGVKGTTTIQFQVVNNGDEEIPYLEVDFFDLSGFKINTLKAETFGKCTGSKCVFSKDAGGTLKSLGSALITLNLAAPENIKSPTPYTVSFAVRYVYFGFRDANIPIIDGITKTQPTTPFRQSANSFGPVSVDINPALSRDVTVGGQTQTQYWGISGSNALPFVTKFRFNSIGSVQGNIQNVNISEGNFRIKIVGLEQLQPCQFDKGGSKEVTIALPQKDSKYSIPIDNAEEYNFISQRPVVPPTDALVCTFKPSQNTPEYTAVISVLYGYKYEFIRTQDFIVQPALPGVTSPTSGSTSGSSGSSSSGTAQQSQFANFCATKENNACLNGMGGCNGPNECDKRAQSSFGNPLDCRDVGAEVKVCCFTDLTPAQCKQAFDCTMKSINCP